VALARDTIPYVRLRRPMKVHEFLVDGRKKGLEVVPMTGEEVQSAVHQVLRRPKT
jgi:hypothetical protein